MKYQWKTKGHQSRTNLVLLTILKLLSYIRQWNAMEYLIVLERAIFQDNAWLFEYDCQYLTDPKHDV